MSRRILLLRDDNFFYYLHQLAVLLNEAGHKVEVLLATFSQAEPLYEELIDDVRSRGVPVHIVKEEVSSLSRMLSRLLAKLHLKQPRLVTRYKIARARRAVRGREFDCVIALDPAALYMAAKLFRNSLEKIVDYSLEVIEESHARFHCDKDYRRLVQFERGVLSRLGGLVIQDKFREGLLLAKVSGYDRSRTVYFPVSVKGPRSSRSKRPQRTNVLFYGGLWSAELIQQLKTAAASLSDEFFILVRGGRGGKNITSGKGRNFEIDTTPISFEGLDELFCQADIGIALYPGRDKNCRTTAFSSEKIARYCKAGVPFIAFDNEDYRYLKSRHDCCALISDYSELPDAIIGLAANLEYYRRNAFLAFEEFYRLENSSQRLLEFVADFRRV